MDHALTVVLGVLAGLFDLVVAVVAVVEGGVRRLLARVGIIGQVQTAILAVVLVALIVTAFRRFGRLFAVLLAVVLLLLLLHVLLAGHPMQG